MMVLNVVFEVYNNKLFGQLKALGTSNTSGKLVLLFHSRPKLWDTTPIILPISKTLSHDRMSPHTADSSIFPLFNFFPPLSLAIPCCFQNQEILYFYFYFFQFIQVIG